MTNERWIHIHGYIGVYEVSNFGNVRRIGRIGKLTPNDVQAMRELRNQGIIFQAIANQFHVTQRAVISALTYQCKGIPHRVPFRMLKPQSNSSGYATVQLCMNGIPKQFAIHRLVANAFLGPCPVGKEVNHKNGIKADARLENLEYVTCSENAIHAHRILKTSNNPRPGAKNNTAKLTNSDVLRIRNFYEKGITAPYLAIQFSVSRDNIYRIVKRQTWKHI